MRAIDGDELIDKMYPFVSFGSVDYCELKMMVNSMLTIQPEQRWIPVSENTLPEMNRVVVVCGEKGTWDYGTYRGHGDDIHFWHWKKNTYKHVYWWMYKEDAIALPYQPDDGKE